MIVFKINDSGNAIKTLQYRLRKVLNRRIAVDGEFGPKTERAVKDFQKLAGIKVDGIVGKVTLASLDRFFKTIHQQNSGMLHFGKRRFVVFVDAGHGGIDDSGKYTTAGKYMNHPEQEMHEDGWYYEGYENRLVAEAFIEECTRWGIMCVRTYHPFKDTSLSDRTELVRAWLRRGYYGYLHSFHSNAISLSYSKEKLDNTRGFICFNTRGDTFSDEITSQHYKHVEEEFGDDWQIRKQLKDGDADYEANFQILRQTDLHEFNLFGAILDEWGFHTSELDTLFITKPENRARRVACCVRTAQWVEEQMRIKKF